MVSVELGSVASSLKKAARDPRRAIQNGIYDQFDRLPKGRAIPHAETFLYPHTLVERIIPTSVKEKLLRLTESFEVDAVFRARQLVGDKELHTTHPHDFVIIKNNVGSSFYFVDPEQTVGKRNPLRPSISNLAGFFIPTHPQELVKILALRFNTDDVDPKRLHMNEQLDCAISLMDDSLLPPYLQEHPEKILFWLQTGEPKSFVKARYSLPSDMRAFLEGRRGSLFLEGKVQSHKEVVWRFLNLLQENEFRRVN